MVTKTKMNPNSKESSGSEEDSCFVVFLRLKSQDAVCKIANSKSVCSLKRIRKIFEIMLKEQYQFLRYELCFVPSHEANELIA